MDTQPEILFFAHHKGICDHLSVVADLVNPGAVVQFADERTYAGAARPCAYNGILCFPENDPALLQKATQTADDLDGFVPVIGLYEDDDPPLTLAAAPGYAKLAVMLNVNKGWNAIWKQIIEVIDIWQNPIMKSRIEDISLEDVLQMVGASRRSSIVRVDGVNTHNGHAENPLRRRGCISFITGNPEIAWSSGHAGIEAVFELLSLNAGSLEVLKPLRLPAPPNLLHRIEQILLSWALHHDESLHRDANRDNFTNAISMEGIDDLEIVDFCENTGDANRTVENYTEISIDRDDSERDGAMRADSGCDADDSGPRDEERTLEAPEEQIAIFDVCRPSRAPRAAFDIWWSRHADSLVSRADISGHDGYPVRWMADRELNRLFENADGARAIYFAGPGAIDLLLAFSGIEHLKNQSYARPVVRFGRFDTTNLYLVAIEDFEELPESLRSSPIVVCGDSTDNSRIMRILGQRHAPLAVFVSEAPQTLVSRLEEDSGDAPLPAFFAMERPAPERTAIGLFVQALLKAFAEMGAAAL